MKLPKSRNAYCRVCKKHTEHKVTEAKRKTPFTSHPNAYGSKPRARLRGRFGFGNLGRYSKPAVNKWRLAGRKQSKKVDLRFECGVCKKKFAFGKAWRAKRVEFA